MNPGFIDMVLDMIRAALERDGGARASVFGIELAVLGLTCLASVAMVALGVLAMKGAAKDVLDVMDRLPPPPDKAGERPARERVLEDFKALFLRRSAPGALLAGSWALVLLVAVARALWRVRS